MKSKKIEISFFQIDYKISLMREMIILFIINNYIIAYNMMQ